MKKLLVLAFLFSFALISIAQDFTISKPGIVVQILTADTLASAGADTVDLDIRTIKGHPLMGSIQVTSENISGTSEGYIDLYASNDMVNWELATRVAGDTLTSSNLGVIKTESTGYLAKYLRAIITNKTQTQSTIYNIYIYPVVRYD